MKEQEGKREGRGGENEEKIAAYLDGEMTPQEVAAFENRMKEDEALRREVDHWRRALDAAREWMSAEAPGVERVASLAIPSLVKRTDSVHAADAPLPSARPSARVWRIRSLAWGALAAAAIFVAGFCLGQITPRAGVPAPSGSAERPSVKQGATPAPTPRAMPTPESGQVEVAAAHAQRYTDEHGRLVIETTLKGSGARALWVVDGKFSLAQFSPIATGGEQ
jgi:anti-sigma factor RsiW